MHAMARKAKKARIRTPHILVPPTPERMAKAGSFIHRSATGPITVRDAPLERLEARGIIDKRLYDAAVKYRLHWNGAGLQERYASLRLDGVFGGGVETITDAMAHHRSVYEGAVKHLGVRQSNVVEDVCCRDIQLADVGYKLGWTNRPQAVAAAEALLKDALDRLAYWWGVS